MGWGVEYVPAPAMTPLGHAVSNVIATAELFPAATPEGYSRASLVLSETSSFYLEVRKCSVVDTSANHPVIDIQTMNVCLGSRLV